MWTNIRSTEESIMRNGNRKIEAIIHVDETLDEARRRDLTGALEQHDGIYATELCPLRYHLILINYDRELLSSQNILRQVGGEHVTAQLIGPI
jgi:hypothetical protein